MHSHWTFLQMLHTQTRHMNWKKFSKDNRQKDREKKLATVLNHNLKSDKNKPRPHKQNVLILCSSDFTFLYFLNENNKVKCRFHCFVVEKRMEDISDKSLGVREKLANITTAKGRNNWLLKEHSTKTEAEQQR